MRDETLLALIMKPGGLQHVFQPVFRMTTVLASVHFSECLTRGPGGTNMESAGVLFEYLRRKGREGAADTLCVKGCLAALAKFPSAPSVSINVHASTLERDPGFVTMLVEEADRNNFPLSKLVLEIVEYAPAWGGPRFLSALRSLRSKGVRVALDDVGLGQSNYRMILDARPDYLKVDAYIVRGCHHDRERQAVIASLVQLARSLGTQVIAEGIECSAELSALRLLDVELMQGFYLSRPVALDRAIAIGVSMGA